MTHLFIMLIFHKFPEDCSDVIPLTIDDGNMDVV